MAREHKDTNPRLVIQFLFCLKMHRDYDATSVAPMISDFNEALGYPGPAREHGVGYDEMYAFIERFYDLNGIGSDSPALSVSEKVSAREYLNKVRDRVEHLLTKNQEEILKLAEIESRLDRDKKMAASIRLKLGLDHQ
jgi:hypothetical protein